MIKCDKNEHHYDSKKHSTCPYCMENRSNNNNDNNENMRSNKDKTVANMGGRSKSIGTVGINRENNNHIKENNPQNKEPNKEPKTIGVWKRKTKPAPLPIKEHSNPPVVGWLVIIEGNNKGQDFKIIPGINSIGRGSSNTIDMSTGDNEISREKHCVIEFDYKHNEFYLERGTGSTRLNDKRVGGDGTALNNKDNIEIGNTILKFVALADENFNWEF